MNRYQDMMDKVPIPAGQAERLKTAVLAAGPKGRRGTYRPRSFAKKVLLAALIAAALTATVGAAVAGVNWDRVFTDRLGAEAAVSPVAGALFQKLDATAVCGDVELTVRQAVMDDRTLYLLWEYHLPPSMDAEILRNMGLASENDIWPAEVYLLQGDSPAWDEIPNTKEEERTALWRQSLVSDSYGGEMRVVTSDLEDRTVTQLLVCVLRDGGLSSQEPLTLLVEPIQVEIDGQLRPLAGHNASITFQPTHVVTERKGSAEGKWMTFTARLLPLSLRIETRGKTGSTPPLEELKAAVLRCQDGTRIPVSDLILWDELYTAYGRTISDGRVHMDSDTTIPFKTPLDPAQVEAVLVGDMEIPLS